MKSRLLFISCLTLVAVTAAAGHTRLGIDKFNQWLRHVPNSNNVINSPHVIVEHQGKYCVVSYSSDRRGADPNNVHPDDIVLSNMHCLEKSEFDTRKFGLTGKTPAINKIDLLHVHACAGPDVCGSQTIGPYVYNWCPKDPVPPSEPKMNVDIFYGSPAGAHIDKQSANSSGRPGSCPAP